MRLIEPLSGLKMLQGHVLTHMVFFAAMLFVECEWGDEASTSSTVDGAEAAAQLLRMDNNTGNYYTNDLI